MSLLSAGICMSSFSRSGPSHAAQLRGRDGQEPLTSMPLMHRLGFWHYFLLWPVIAILSGVFARPGGVGLAG